MVFSDISFKNIQFECRKVVLYGECWIIKPSPDLVRFFFKCSPEKNQIRSGFSQVFSKFWSVLSLDFHAFSGIQDISKLFPYS